MRGQPAQAGGDIPTSPPRLVEAPREAAGIALIESFHTICKGDPAIWSNPVPVMAARGKAHPDGATRGARTMHSVSVDPVKATTGES
jgi:hypothetical protein